MHGPSDALIALVACMKKGFGGNPRNKTKVSTGVAAVDLGDSCSPISFQKCGDFEEFAGGLLSDLVISRQPRWFKFGPGCVITVTEQQEIVRELMGRMAITETDGILSRGVCRETANRRKQLFAKFYRQEDSTLFTPFLNMDVPQLMFRYLDLWKEVKLTEWGKANKWVKIIRRSFEPEDLLRTEADFRMMLMCSNAIGKMQVKNNVLLPGCRDAVFNWAQSAQCLQLVL